LSILGNYSMAHIVVNIFLAKKVIDVDKDEVVG
jgi:hypothetical protein